MWGILGLTFRLLLVVGTGARSSGSYRDVLVAAWQQNDMLVEKCYRFFRFSWQVRESTPFDPRGGVGARALGFLLNTLNDEVNFMFAGISIQIVLCVLVSQLPPKADFTYYWLNPILALSSVLSPLPALEHLMVISQTFFFNDWLNTKGTLQTIFKGLQVLVVVASSLKFDINYLLLLPFLLSTVSKQEHDGAQESWKENWQPSTHHTLWMLRLIALLILADSILNISNHSRSFGDTFSPSAGLYWYFEAQLFKEYRKYFIPLIAMQPSLISILLHPWYCQLTASSIDQDGGHQQAQDKGRRLLGYHLMVAVIILFKPAMSLTDIAFAVTLLLTYHGDVLQRVRYKVWILTGILVPTTLSPLLAHAWIDKGTGNANFLFFQCLALWFFCALAIVEVIKATSNPSSRDEHSMTTT